MKISNIFARVPLKAHVCRMRDQCNNLLHAQSSYSLLNLAMVDIAWQQVKSPPAPTMDCSIFLHAWFTIDSDIHHVSIWIEEIQIASASTCTILTWIILKHLSCEMFISFKKITHSNFWLTFYLISETMVLNN